MSGLDQVGFLSEHTIDEFLISVAGRRVCPGNNVADTNLWIMLSRLIYCFDIEEDPVSLRMVLPNKRKLTTDHKIEQAH